MSGPHDLEQLVRAHVPIDDAPALAVALEAVGSSRPMWPRSQFHPGHFTASGFVASPDHSSLLLVEHARLEKWLQPGGHIEAEDASVEAAARREVGEETGVDGLLRLGGGILRIDAHSIPARGSEPAHTHIDLGIGFLAVSDRIGDIAEVLDARWVPFDQLGRFDTDDAVRMGASRLRDLL